jgi:hypothetical protein
MMETSAMAMPWGMARRSSPRASTQMGDLSVEGRHLRLGQEGGFKGGGNARPAHSTAQNPFQDVMAQREL